MIMQKVLNDFMIWRGQMSRFVHSKCFTQYVGGNSPSKDTSDDQVRMLHQISKCLTGCCYSLQRADVLDLDEYCLLDFGR